MSRNPLLTEELRKLELDAAWRRSEISYLRKQEALTRFDPVGTTGYYRNSIYLRLLVTSLYAHHEGYAIRCWDTVYSVIDASGVTPSALSSELQLLVLGAELKRIRNASPLELLDMYTRRIGVFPASYSFSQARPVRSDGNLKPKPYLKAFSDLGISLELTTEESGLLYQLVELRNDVVHGRVLPPNVVHKFDEFTGLVYDLQDRSLLSTTTYLEAGKYLANTAASGTP